MRNNTVLIICLVAATSVLSGCGRNYNEVARMNTRYAEVTEAYTSALAEADSAEDVAKAMNSYTDDMLKIWPTIEKLSQKHPELKDPKNVPEAVRESQKRAETASQKMAATFMKLTPYMNNPEVINAQKRLVSAMAKQ